MSMRRKQPSGERKGIVSAERPRGGRGDHARPTRPPMGRSVPYNDLVRKRDENTEQHVESALAALADSTAQRAQSIEACWASSIGWEDNIRRICREAIPISPKEYAPTMAQIAHTLGISEKTLQHIRARPDGTAAWPRPTDLS